MKKKWLLVIVLFAAQTAHAQFTLSTLYTGWFLPKNDSLPRMDRMIFSLTQESLLNNPKEVNVSAFSWGTSLNRVFDIPFNKHIGIGIGFGFTWHNFHHNGEFVIDVNADNTTFTNWKPFDTPREYKVNKLTLIYLDANFQFRIRFGKLYGFRLYPGFKAGYLLSDYRKYKDATSKIKVYRLDNLSELRYGPTIHISLGNYAITGFYSLTDLFDKDRGYKTQIFSVGLSYLFI